MKLSDLYLYKVAISNRQTTGTRLATITINKTDYDLYYTNTTYSAGSGLKLVGTVFSLDLTKELITSTLGYTPPTSSGSIVTISNRQTSGTRLATINIDGTPYDLYYTDLNTTYTAGTGLTLNNNEFSLNLTSSLIISALGYTPANVSNVGTSVSVVCSQTAGTNTATITVDGTPYNIYYTDTTYSAGGGLSLSGTTFSLPTTGIAIGGYGPTENTTISNGGSFSVPYYTVDSYGRLTASVTRTLTLSSISSGSTVSISNRQTTGTRLATLTINGTAYDLYYTDTVPSATADIETSSAITAFRTAVGLS